MKKKVISMAAILTAASLLVVSSVYGRTIITYVSEFFEPTPATADYGTVKKLTGDFRQQEISDSQTDAVWTKGSVTIRKPDGTTSKSEIPVGGFEVETKKWPQIPGVPDLEYKTFGSDTAAP
ncbi:hypothetical protein ACP26L_02260 [Paenibacillus sp. S-38]|uniref:hypothetical protein n=1 Tax=Paenibacillus sp. S-38 TaxID=3416710 RepID=UPI003CF3C8A1